MEKKKRISCAAGKSKGRRLQQWICEKISDLTGFPWGHDCPIESRPMGQCGVDVRLEKKVKKLFPFSIEAKNQESWSIPAYIKQAMANEEEGSSWLLIVAKNRTPPIAILDAEKFFEILGQKEKLRRTIGQKKK